MTIPIFTCGFADLVLTLFWHLECIFMSFCARARWSEKCDFGSGSAGPQGGDRGHIHLDGFCSKVCCRCSWKWAGTFPLCRVL